MKRVLHRCRKWYEGNPADDTRIVPRPGSEAGQLWNAYGAFQKNLWLWTETNQWIFDFSSGVPAEQLMLVRSEEMFAAEEKTLKNLFSFIGSPIPSKTKISRVLGQVINAQSEGEFPESPDWSDAMHDDFATIAGKMAKHFNYEVQ